MTELALTEVEDALSVRFGDVELCRYIYRPGVRQVESPRPYLHPVRRLDGTVVSLFRPHDHVWHQGISLALPNVGDQNFWGGPTFVRDRGYVGLPNNGSQVHTSFEAAEVVDGSARIDERLTWVTQAGETWLTERRGLTISVLPDEDAWVLSFVTSLTNCRGATIGFGSPTTEGRPNAGYAGLFWRGPRSFNRGTILASDDGGGPEMMGRRATWLAYVGKHDEVDATSTVAFFDHPDNLQYPTKWFVRSEPYACVCPAPFFDEVHDLPDGETLTLRYTVAVAAGAWEADRLTGVIGPRAVAPLPG